MPSSDPLEMMIETFSIVAGLGVALAATVSVVMTFLLTGLDAAPGLRDPGDAGRNLRRALGEELVQLFDRHAGALAEGANRRPRSLVEILLAHEANDLPVLFRHRIYALATRQLGHHRLAPLFGVKEEAFFVGVDVD